MLLYKSIGKSTFSGNLQQFQDFLTMLTGISDHTLNIWNYTLLMHLATSNSGYKRQGPGPVGHDVL